MNDHAIESACVAFEKCLRQDFAGAKRRLGEVSDLLSVSIATEQLSMMIHELKEWDKKHGVSGRSRQRDHQDGA